MARVHNELTRGPWGTALKAALNDTKSEGGLERFGETMTPVIDLWRQPEWSILRGERLWAQRTSVAGVAAELSGVAVVNPAGSNSLVIVDTASGTMQTAANSILLGPTTATVIAATYTQSNSTLRETRGFAGVNPQIQVPQIWNGSNLGSLLTNAEILDQIISATVTVVPFYCGVPYVLKPGFALLAEGATVNIAIEVNFGGRVRNLYRGELVLP